MSEQKIEEYRTKFSVDDKEYSLVVDLNVFATIQKKYGTLAKWGEITDGAGEPDIEAVIFGYTEMMNEAVEIENEENGENKPYFTQRQVGRIITKLGMLESTKTLNSAVIEASKNDNQSKN